MSASVPAQGKHKQEAKGDSWRVEWMKTKILSNPSQPNQSQATARKQARRKLRKQMDEPNSADPQDASERKVISLNISGRGGKWDAS